MNNLNRTENRELVVEILKDDRGSLVMRKCDSGTVFICCTGFNPETGNWFSGEYFECLDDAMDCFHGRIKRRRLEDIAQESINGLMSVGGETGADYIYDNVMLSLDEARTFDVVEAFYG